MNFDSDDMMPTRRECEAEAFQDAVDKSCLKDPWYVRAYEVAHRLSTRQKNRYWVLFEYRLENKMDDMRREEAEEMRDQAAYDKDIYAYHGVRRSDF